MITNRASRNHLPIEYLYCVLKPNAIQYLVIHLFIYSKQIHLSNNWRFTECNCNSNHMWCNSGATHCMHVSSPSTSLCINENELFDHERERTHTHIDNPKISFDFIHLRFKLLTQFHVYFMICIRFFIVLFLFFLLLASLVFVNVLIAQVFGLFRCIVSIVHTIKLIVYVRMVVPLSQRKCKW